MKCPGCGAEIKEKYEQQKDDALIEVKVYDKDADLIVSCPCGFATTIQIDEFDLTE